MKHIVETVAELRGVSVENRGNGSSVHVAGYYAAGDKEACIYIYDAASSLTDNGGSVLEPNSGSGRWLLKKDITSIADFGAIGDDSTDNTTFIQAAFDNHNGRIFIPSGIFRYTTPIVMAGIDWGGIEIFGAGIAVSVLKPVGCHGFLLSGQGYYRAKFHDFALFGVNNPSEYFGFALLPSVVTNVVGGAEWYNLDIRYFLAAWGMKNAQINYFHDCNIFNQNEDYSTFLCIPDEESGQQSNANRVHRLLVTGFGAIIKCQFGSASERATNWRFIECDIQLQGTTIPFHIIDSYYTIEGCEFENSNARCLIHLEATGASMAPNNTRIHSNIFLGADVAIRSSQAEGAAQRAFYVTIEGNITPSGNFLDLESGVDWVIGPHNGTVNNTGGEYIIRLGGRDNLGQVTMDDEPPA